MGEFHVRFDMANCKSDRVWIGQSGYRLKMDRFKSVKILSQLGCVLSKVDSYNFKYCKKNNSKIYILKLLKDKKN